MRFFILPAAILFAASVNAQHNCGTTQMQEQWFLQHPELRENFVKLQQQAEETDREMSKTNYARNTVAKSLAATNFTIPVVFHILHKGGSENISDAQVIDAVNILTRDFNKQNADTSMVVTQFKNVIGNPQVSFALATKDPNGNCTNGIIRHWDANTDWPNSFAAYAYSWPSTRYLNIYVVKTISSGAAGYTYLPGSGVPGSADAIVILSNYVGSIGTGQTGLSRALTHEVGHWLNLSHTWGSTNNPGVACGNDGVSDTPVTKGFTSCNLNSAAICNPSVVENMQNYMDYAYCQRMFTMGQAARVQTALNSSTASRNNLSSSTNLAVTGITSPGSGCIPYLEINALPGLTICEGKSLSFVSYTSNAAPSSYSWSADNGAIVANPSASVTSITFPTAGTTTVTCVASTTAGSVSKNIVIDVKTGLAEVAFTYTESFEGNSSSSMPLNWTILNPTSPSVQWESTTDAAYDGATSMFIAGENLPANSIEILETPSYDFKNNPNAVFSFRYAYAKKTSTSKDIFKVQASKDCGGTWTDIYFPSNSTLASGSGEVLSMVFVPSSFEWKLYDQLTNHPSFSSFKSESNVRLRFYFQEDVGGSGYGNRFYLDQVNFEVPITTGANELTRSLGFNVFPNPAGSEVNVAFSLQNEATMSYQITSATGAVVLSKPASKYSSGEHVVKIDTENLSRGIYFLTLEHNGAKMSRKIAVE